MDMHTFNITRTTRQNILNLIEDLSVEQLNTIPVGFNNNIVWQLGHVLATQQLLTYGLSDNDVLVTENIIEEFRKGTTPDAPYLEDDIEEIKSIFLEVIDRTQDDFEEKFFESFNAYETSYGVSLGSIEEALVFNNVHEGLHLGIIMSMKKLV
jgi:hypothetical protein